MFAGFAAAAVGYLSGQLDGSPHFPLLANAVGLHVLLICTAAMALADVRRFRTMLLLVAVTHAVQVGSLILATALEALPDTVSIFQLVDAPATGVLGLWAVYGLCLTALFATLYRRAPRPGLPLPSEREVGWPQELLRFALVVNGAAFLFSIGFYVYRASEGEADFAFLAASVPKDALFLALTLLALRRPARWSSLTLVVVLGLFALVATNVALLLSGTISGPAPVFGSDPPLGGQGVDVARTWVLLDLVCNALLLTALWLYQRARYRLDYLSPPAVRALEAFADALFELVPETVPPRRVAEKVDDYLAAFKGRAKGRIHLALVGLYYLPILWHLAPFSALSRERRLAWAQRRFDDVDMAAAWPLGRVRRMLRALIRGSQQFAYVGYYSLREGWETTGFKPFSEREDFAQKVATVDPNRPGVDVVEPWEVCGRELEADVVVVGSGAAGAILAYRLAEAGRQVVVLERGPHVRPAQMTEDEMEMFARLYADGALQLSKDFEFQVTQGRCVGGSTTVNNGVCLEPSQAKKEEWLRRVPALKLDKLDTAFAAARSFVGVWRQPDAIRPKAAKKLEEGLVQTGRPVHRVEANIRDCLGSGYCNSGCAYGKKLSMLDTVLLHGQLRFGDRLRIVAECEARRIVRRHGRARAVKCRLSDGRRLRVTARDKVIVSAGAIASSRLLHRSLIGGRRVGKGLTFNLRTAVAARFPDVVDSWAGLQMTDWHRPSETTPWMIESWAVPVVSQALAMPGWFGHHERMMRELRHVGWAGILAGTETEGRVRRFPMPWNDSEFAFKPEGDELRALTDAFVAAAKALFAAGSETVMISTHRPIIVSRDGDTPEAAAGRVGACLDRFFEDSSDVLNLGSSHPQGGNSMSEDRRGGVVDSECRVHGYDNLYVCDASVFPTSVTVNPQLTVMALAEYTAQCMLG